MKLTCSTHTLITHQYKHLHFSEAHSYPYSWFIYPAMYVLILNLRINHRWRVVDRCYKKNIKERFLSRGISFYHKEKCERPLSIRYIDEQFLSSLPWMSCIKTTFFISRVSKFYSIKGVAKIKEMPQSLFKDIQRYVTMGYESDTHLSFWHKVKKSVRLKFKTMSIYMYIPGFRCGVLCIFRIN